MKHMIIVALRQFLKPALAATLCAAAFSRSGLAQVPPPSVLRIDTVNAVVYFQDTGDVSKFAADPGTPTPMSFGKIFNFNQQIGIADIQAVNGQPVMGVHTRVGTFIGLGSSPTPGHAVADVVRNATDEIAFEILKSDGTPVGTIMASGFIGGASPPGSPSKVTVSNIVVTGGTGAFLGARGQVGTEDPPSGVAIQRSASITEDPANRRSNGGGSQRWVIHLIPMTRPEIVIGPGGPA